MNEEEPLISCSIHQMWSYYCHVTGLWQAPEALQNDLKGAYYSGFAALLAVLENLTELDENEASERLRHYHQELQFSMRRQRRGSLSKSE